MYNTEVYSPKHSIFQTSDHKILQISTLAEIQHWSWLKYSEPF